MVDRVREEVWGHVIEQNEWRRSDGLKVRKLAEGPPDVRSRYADRVKLIGRAMSIMSEVRQLEPPAIVSWARIGEEGPA